MPKKTDKWKELGERVARARNAAQLAQQELARKIGIDRTALAKIETGKRGIDALELTRLAVALGRPIEWFVSQPSRAAAGRRAKRHQEVMDESPADIALEVLERDVALLHQLGTLKETEAFTPAKKVQTPEEAMAVAADLRKHLKVKNGPVWDLAAVAEKIGLHAFTNELPDETLEGSYLAAGEQMGVALINGDAPSGRRRFTLAHELGHHVFQDPYSTEWVVDHSSRSREKLVNAFAIHFLLPGADLKRRWAALKGKKDPRAAAITLAAEYGVSWTALCPHLERIGILTQQQRRMLEKDPPRRHDYLELGISVRELPPAPTVPPRFAQAVVRAYKAHKITRARALEMLRGTIEDEELPESSLPPLEALRAEMESGPDE